MSRLVTKSWLKRLITDILKSLKDADKYKSEDLGVFGTSKILSTEDVALLNNYNKLLEQGKSYNEAFELSLKNASISAQNMAINAGGASVNLQKMTIAERAAATGAKLLSSALKFGAGLLVGSLINVAIGWIEKLVDKYTNAQEHIQEFANSFSDSMQSAKEEQKAVYDLTSQYIKAVASTNDLKLSKEELQSIQDTLINKYGDEAKSIDLVNGKISEQITALLKLKKEQAENDIKKISITDPQDSDNKLSGTMAYKTAKKYIEQTGELKSVFKDYDDYMQSIPNNQRFTEIQRSLNEFEVTATGSYQKVAGIYQMWTDDFYDLLSKLKGKVGIDGNAENLYFGGSLKQQIDSMKLVYDELSKKWENFDTNSEEQKWLSDLAVQINSLQEQYDGLNSAIQEYETLQKIIKESDNSKTTEKALNNLNDLKNSYIDAMNNGNYSNMDNYYNQLKQEKINLEKQFKNNEDILQAIQDFFNALPTKINTDVFDITQFSEDIDNLQTKIKSLKETLSKLKDGSITQDELIDFTQEYGLTEYINDIPKLQSELEKLIQTSPDELINKLWELRKSLGDTDKVKVDNLINRLERLTNTSENIGESAKKVKEYSDKIKSLASTINGLSKQINDLNKTIDDLKEKQSDLQDENSGLQQAYEYLIDQKINKINDEIKPHQQIIDELELENELLQIQNDNYQLQLDKIEEEISKYQTASNTVQDYIDKQTKAIEDSYQARIDKIQEENDAINEQLDLEKKKDAYENAKRKQKLVYTGASGLQMVTDQTAVNEAKQEYDNALVDNQVKALEKERDTKIKSWEEYAQRWSAAVDKINGKADELTANEVLGSDWRTKITNKDIDTLNNFSKKYNDYVNKQKTPLEKKIKNNEKEINSNNKVINNEKKIIESKNAVIDKWNNYKDQLSSIVSQVEGINNKYLSNLKSLIGNENLTLENRNKNLELFKQRYAQNVKDISDITNSLKVYENNKTDLENQKKAYANLKQKYTNLKKKYSDESKTDKGSKVTKYKVVIDGKIIGISLTKNGAEEIKQAYIDKEIASRKSAQSILPWSKQTEVFSPFGTDPSKQWEEELKKKIKINSYSTGGTIDYTGIANVHGKPSQPEVIFNSSQAKKLYDFIANTKNLSEVIGNKIANNLGNSTINNIVNKSDTNNTPVNFVIQQVIANNPVEFAKQIEREVDNIFKQVNFDRMIGKIKK